MKNYRFIRALMFILLTLMQTLASCGGERGGTPPRNTGIGQVRQVSGVNESIVVLRTISITPNNTLGINSGTQLHFAAMGSYSDYSVQVAYAFRLHAIGEKEGPIKTEGGYYETIYWLIQDQSKAVYYQTTFGGI
jgi:hypothetical protein